MNQDPSVGPVGVIAPTATPILPLDIAQPAACSWWDDIWPSQACMVAQAQAQIQSVAQNAATYYGSNSETADIAQQMATAQEALSSDDVANIEGLYNSSSALTASIPWYVWAALAGLSVFLVSR